MNNVNSYSETSKGNLLVVISAISYVFALYLIKLSPNGQMTLIIGNLISCFIARMLVTDKKLNHKSSIYLVFLWSIAYSCSYSIFSIFAKDIYAPTIIFFKLLSPYVAIYILGEHKIEKNGIRYLILGFAIIYFVSNGIKTTSIWELAIFLLFIVSMSINRKLSKSESPMKLSMYLSLFNFFNIYLITHFINPDLYIISGTEYIWPIVLGPVIIATQFTYLKGIKYALPFVSVAILNASVPLTIFIDSTLGNSFSILTIISAVIYLLIVSFMLFGQLFEGKKRLLN